MDKTYRILVVDDDPLMLRATERVVQSLGHEVITAENGTRALEIIESTPPDLVLLDVDMPDVDGIEVCRTIKSQKQMTGVFIVMLSSSRTDEEDELEGLEYGEADGYITRPLPNRVLKARIQAYLRLKAAEEAKLVLERRLNNARRFEATAKMAGGIAHDFNNLLTIIMGNIEMAKEEMHPETAAMGNIDQAYAAGRRAMELTRKFLLLSDGSMPVKNAQDIGPIIEQALLQATANQQKINVRTRIDDSLPPLYIDERQIRLALEYVMTNAVAAMAENGGELQVSATGKTFETADQAPLPSLEGGVYVEITVSDTGCGIDEKTLPKIFDPYFSTKQMGNKKGMGLGLTTAYAIASRHGGEIEVRSEKGTGTVCTIYLPVKTP